jgi:hypothetical protein
MVRVSMRPANSAAVTALVLGLLVGCDGGASQPMASRPATPRTSASTGQGGVADGIEVGARIRLGGRRLVAGGLWAPASRRFGTRCLVGCNPVVWDATVATHWRPVLVVPAEGSVVLQHFVRASWGLLLTCSGEATTMWKSADGRAWRSVGLPAGMVAGSVVNIKRTSMRRVVVTLVYRKEIGRPKPRRWVTLDGTHWART